MTMTTTLTTAARSIATSDEHRLATRPVWRHGLAAAVVASAATLAIAAVAAAAGVSFADQTDRAIPPAGFPQLTMIFALIGIAMAAVIARRAKRPQSTFVRTTVALTALSVVPDFLVGVEARATVVLMLTHLVAAAIVIPTLASRLER